MSRVLYIMLLIVVTLSLVLSTHGYNCTQGNQDDADTYAAQVDAVFAAGGDPNSVVYTYDKACSQCFGENGYCIDKDVVNAESEDDLKTLKSQYRQFYDCKTGSDTITTTDDDGNGQTNTFTAKYCELKPNSKYYAVIIVPVLAFSFAIMGLAYYLRIKFFKGYQQPNKDTSIEMTA